MHSKIGQFSSRTSILMILDFLYSGIFQKDYDANLDYLIKINNRVRKVNSRFEPLHEE
jgi:DNA-binding MurR/RpiR family transcriptional regulator